MLLLLVQLNVGCTAEVTSAHPVRLEFSEDGGKSWRLVVPECSQDAQPSCADQTRDASVYYAGVSPFWRRVVIPLSGLRICG